MAYFLELQTNSKLTAVNDFFFQQQTAKYACMYHFVHLCKSILGLELWVERDTQI